MEYIWCTWSLFIEYWLQTISKLISISENLPLTTSQSTCNQVIPYTNKHKGFEGFIRPNKILPQIYTTFLRMDSFRWSQEATVTFERLKEAITPAPILILPDFTQFIIECEASGGGLGVSLLAREEACCLLS